MKKLSLLLLITVLYFSSSAQWVDKEPLNLSATSIITAVHFTSADTGHIASGDGIFKTNNGGDTWTGSGIASSNNSLSIFFAGSNTGYVAGNSMYKTIDGGSTWTALPAITGAQFTPDENLQFTDNHTGFVNGSHGSVFKTSDGGNTWNQIKNAGGTGSVLGMWFVDDMTGYTVGYQIKKTTDGGTTWVSQTPPTADLLNATHFVSTTEGWAVGDAGVIIHTTDGGSTWVQQTSGTGQKLKSVFFSNNQIGVAVGANGIILRTVDGGTTWVSQMSNTTEQLNRVFFYDANVGYAVGYKRTIRKTVNGGSAPLSTGDFNIKNTLTVYPNPTSNKLHIETSFDLEKIELYNTMGSIVFSKKASSSISLSSLSEGIYFAKIYTHNKLFIRKIEITN